MKIEKTTLRKRVSAAGKELRTDESGAMMVIGLFFALFLVGALYYLLGIGQAALYRERMQDAADTAAFAGAVFKARAMNFIALINMIMALLLAILIAIYSLYLMLMALYVVFQIMCAIPWTAAVGCPGAAVAIKGANIVKNIYNAAKRVIDPIIKVGSTAGEAISNVAPFVAPVVSFTRVAEAYRPPATFGVSFSVPNPVQRLPTRKAPYKELCDKALEYANYPFELIKNAVPVLGHILGFIGQAFNTVAAAVVCGGSTAVPDLSSVIQSESRRHGAGGGRAGYVVPRNADQVNCYQNGDEAACDRFARWQRESAWDQTQGICTEVEGDPVTLRANLPAGALPDRCSQRVSDATAACMTRNGNRFGYRYTLKEMARYVEVTVGMDGTPIVTRQAVPTVRRLWIEPPPSDTRGLDRPLCGQGGSWSTSMDINRCISPRSTSVEPAGDAALIGPLPNDPDAAIVQIERVLRENPNPSRRVTLKWTQVHHILQCLEPVPNSTPDLVQGADGSCDSRPQWVMPAGIQLGDEPFQQWGAVMGERSGAWSPDRYTRGVEVANSFRSGGNIGGIDSITGMASHLSFAQAEFYYEGPNADDRKQWLWNMGWTARMRRVRLPESFGGRVAEAGSRVGDGNGGRGFNLGSQIVDTVIIH